MGFVSTIDSLRARAASKKRRSKGGRLPTRVRPIAESLEPRALLSAVTWSVLSDTTGTSPGTNPYSIRGLALTNDGSSIYAGYIHSDAINELSTSTAAIEATVSTPTLQPKGVATDDRGFVYSTLNSGSGATTQHWAIYNSNLTPVTGSPFTSATTASKQISGMAVQKLNGHYYAYISSNKGAGTIERWDVTTPTSPTLDTSWGTNGIIDLRSASFGLGSNTYVNGLVVDTDGTVYATGGVNTTDRGDSVFKISPDGLSVEKTATVSGALDDAIFDGELYVTEYLGPNSTIAVLKEADLSLVATITGVPIGAYANTTPDAQGYDAGYSGIDISASGKVYVAEQLYTNNLDGLFHDRILVSSPLAAPAITSPNTATFPVSTADTFTVTSTGSPTAALSETGVLPTGVTFTDNGDGTATLAGTPAAGTQGTYPITITAHSYVANATQAFTLIVPKAPTITSAATTTFVVGTPGMFTVTATGAPAPALSETGALPGGVTFVDNGNGTATLSGTAAAGSQGTYPLTITASNGVNPAATQNFTLVVHAAPAITSANAANFAEGAAGAFTVTATGSPTPALTETGALPSGVTFTDNGNGTATLSGTPVTGTHGTYPLTITASNGVSPNATQTFTLTVSPAIVQSAPAITSPNSTTFTLGAAGAFTVTTTGNPTPTLTETGALPAGVTFVNNGNGTATLSGTPAAGTAGSYPITIVAHNGVGSDATQHFTLTVVAAPISTGFYLAGVPGDGTNATFVHNLYRELLGREGDSGGVAFWNAYLQEHDDAAGRLQVLQAFLNSPEYKSHYVSVLYQVFLGRAPEAGGLQFWTDKMGSPGTPGEHSGSADEKFVFAAILGSDEFYLKAGNTPQGWVNALYEDLFGRAADGAGMTFWTNELATRGAGDRDGIVRDLLTTPEAAHLLLNVFYPAAGGTAAHPLPAPGTAVPSGSTDLAVATGDGWENLYLEGPFDSATEGNDAFFAELAAGAAWDDVQLQLLATAQFYTNPNRPITL